MKKLEILCVGKIKEPYFRDGIAEYVKRLSRFCEVTVTELPDCADDGRAAETESKALLARMNGFTVLTDLRGKELDSERFSELICGAYQTSPKVQLIIGGSRGVSDEVRARANATVSFGRMTYPHRLMRLIAAEQLYRAFCISEGTSYHK